jgi:hypothetical protein
MNPVHRVHKAILKASLELLVGKVVKKTFEVVGRGDTQLKASVLYKPRTEILKYPNNRLEPPVRVLVFDREIRGVLLWVIRDPFACRVEKTDPLVVRLIANTLKLVVAAELNGRNDVGRSPTPTCGNRNSLIAGSDSATVLDR